MRVLDHDEPIDPEVAASLDAIDAVLAGEPVGAEYAELAEIALLLTAERPPVPPEFAQRLDRRVDRRFATAVAPVAKQPRRRRRSAGFWQVAGSLSAGVAALVGIAVVLGGHNGSSSESSSSSSVGLVAKPTTSAGGGGSTAGAAASSAAGSAAGSASAGTQPHRNAAAPNSAQKSAVPLTAASGTASTPSQALSAPSFGAPTLQPPTSGRKVVQSAQLQLGAPANRIDDVAQEVYDVVGSLNGTVENSTVTQTGGSDGSANFQLSVPSGSLGQAMSRLSSLNYASVLSRTDASQDITDQYGAAKRALADARTLRTSLLKQLADATTTEQIDSLKAQIRDAEASISSDQATLNRLNHQVGFSQVAVQIGARSTPKPVAHHSSGGFGIGRAVHDAGRVLTVAAGVALIALAAITPVALVAALLWWVGAAVRRRRREQALDSA
jgi:hypothetical protein